MDIEFLKSLVGYYRIKSERKLRKAAAAGGCRWELAADFTVGADVVVTADRALMIHGKGHCITGTNSDMQSQIFEVGDHADLTVRNTRMVSTIGRCFRVNAGAKLCVDACDLRSGGDGIVNHARIWVCGGTTMQVTYAGAVCIRNLKMNETHAGEVTLYKCVIDSLYNEGTLTLTRNASQIRAVIGQEGTGIDKAWRRSCEKPITLSSSRHDI